jgi:hypothetical protein
MSTDDKGFFITTGLIGSLSKAEEIISAQLINENLFGILIQAGAVAFVSGFIGLFAKKLAEYIYFKLKCQRK